MDLILQGLGLIVLAALFIFGVIEAALRTWEALREKFLITRVSRRDFIDSRYHPYLARTESWSKAMFQYLPVGFRLFNNDNPLPGRVTNNSLGFRCPEFLPPAEDELTVAVMGGSAAWGSGATDNSATIAGQLEALMNADPQFLGRRKRARVFNLAQVNGNQTQDVLSLTFFGPRIKPDIVVSFHGWNELLANYPMKEDILERYRVFYLTELEWWEPIQVGDNNQRQLKQSLWRWLSGKSALASRLQPAGQPDPFDYSLAELQRRLQVASDVFVEHMEQLTLLGKAQGFRHFEFLQPNVYRKLELAPNESSLIKLYDEVRPVHGGKMVGDFLRSGQLYGTVKAKIAQDPQRFGTCIDLGDIFRQEREQMFYTLVHMTDPGYRKVAEHMFDSLRNSL